MNSKASSKVNSVCGGNFTASSFPLALMLVAFFDLDGFTSISCDLEFFPTIIPSYTLSALAPRLADLADLAESAELTKPVGPAEPTDVGDRGSDWERTAIAEFGAMHLLVRAWQERAHLPTDLVASVFQHLGVSVRNEIVLAEPEVEDHWVVAGSQDRAEGRIMAPYFLISRDHLSKFIFADQLQ